MEQKVDLSQYSDKDLVAELRRRGVVRTLSAKRLVSNFEYRHARDDEVIKEHVVKDMGLKMGLTLLQDGFIYFSRSFDQESNCEEFKTVVSVVVDQPSFTRWMEKGDKKWP